MAVGHVDLDHHLKQRNVHHQGGDHHGAHDKAEDDALALKIKLGQGVAGSRKQQQRQDGVGHRNKQRVPDAGEQVHLAGEHLQVGHKLGAGGELGRDRKDLVVGVCTGNKHEVKREQRKECTNHKNQIAKCFTDTFH